MVNILTNIIPDPDTGLYSSRVLGINGNELYIDSNTGWVFNSLLFYLTDTTNPISSPAKYQSDYENKLSYWSNSFTIDPGTFNPGIDRRGWVYLLNTGWTFLVPLVFEQQQYAPIWMWFPFSYNNVSLKWCYLDRSYIGQHWCFEKQYINPVASGLETIYDDHLGGNIKIFESGKLEGFGVRLYVHNLRGTNEDEGMRAFIINSSSQIFMSTETVSQPRKQLTYVKVV